MAATTDARPRRGFRRWAVRLAALFLLLVAAAGTVLWFSHRSSAGPIPPVVPANPLEPEVTAFVEKVRREVLRAPRAPQTWGRLGQAFLANDMEDEAQICFAEAERLDPGNPRWPYYQAVILLNQGQQEAALPYLEHTLECVTIAALDNAAPQLVLAETLLALGRLEEAEGHFRQILARQADNVRAHYGLARAAFARGDWQASRTHLLPCLDAPSAQQKARLQFAAVCLRLGDAANAETYRQQASRLLPDGDWPDPFVTEYLAWAMKKRSRYHHAESLEAAGRLTEAAAVLRPLVQEHPKDYLPRLTLAKILGRLRQSGEAELLLREALQLAPEKVQVHYFLSLVLLGRAAETAQADRDRAASLYREAAQRAQEALALKPDYGFAYMTLGLARKALGQRTDALTALRQAVLCNPEHAELHFYLGEILAEDGRGVEAREQLEEAIRMAPPNAPWKSSALARLAAIRSGAASNGDSK